MKRPRDEDPVELFSGSKNTSSQELCLPTKTKEKERHEIQKAQKETTYVNCVQKRSPGIVSLYKAEQI